MKVQQIFPLVVGVGGDPHALARIDCGEVPLVIEKTV
jgi:hypothetical protein